jgi:hypothetical protein
MAILKDKAYESAYSTTIDELVNKAVNREAFSYDPATDQAYQAYAKEYGRLGDIAREDTLGDVANNTGGLVSSYATTAAAQAQNQYNQALTDKIPELMQAAYARYNDDFNNNLNMIGVLRGLDDAEYGRFADQRDYDRGVLESDRNYNYQIGRDAVADSQWQQQFDYQKDRDSVADKQWQDQFDYQKDRDAVGDSQWQAEYDLSVRAQDYEEKYKDSQAKYEKMFNLWQTTGKATKEVAKYFGVPEGTQTSDYKFAAANLALDQARVSSGGSSGSGGRTGGGSGDGGAYTEEDYKAARDMEFRQFQTTYLTSDKGASKQQKDYAMRLAESLAQSGQRMTTNDITNTILAAAGLDEEGNSIKGEKKKITKEQATYLMIRFGGQ